MLPAISINNLEDIIKTRYEYDEHRIVGIMLARYDIPQVKEIINSSYTYWHKTSRNYFDVFWAGYGEYLPPSEASASKIILDFQGNEKRVYYDQDAFISVKEECNRIFGKSYKDYMQIVLVDYHHGKLWFDESLRLDLKDNDESVYNIMEWVISICSYKSCIKEVKSDLNSIKLRRSIRKITLGDVLSGVSIFTGV